MNIVLGVVTNVASIIDCVQFGNAGGGGGISDGTGVGFGVLSGGTQSHVSCINISFPVAISIYV